MEVSNETISIKLKALELLGCNNMGRTNNNKHEVEMENLTNFQLYFLCCGYLSQKNLGFTIKGKKENLTPFEYYRQCCKELEDLKDFFHQEIKRRGFKSATSFMKKMAKEIEIVEVEEFEVH